MADPRYTAVKLLDKTFRSGSYSNIQLDAGLKNSDLSPQDKRFCTALYYGVIERKITLDHILSGLSSRPLSKLDSIIVTILRCGIYQILYMENVPRQRCCKRERQACQEVRQDQRFGNGQCGSQELYQKWQKV
ncbi:MAG TPA: transcription antitermination factor NusB [Ruminococcus flavefaciens]|nr:transcription antitermination factor NusB [Ruminococcus flavefaciens]HQL98965.1 transcription antitermination factor NusB [Ruminococcus flavefaciens]